MIITNQKSIVKKSELINPNKESFGPDTLVRPRESTGFTFDRQHHNNIMVFSIQITITVEYSIKCRYIYIGYDGHVFNDSNQIPNIDVLLSLVPGAYKRLIHLFREELKKHRLVIYETSENNLNTEPDIEGLRKILAEDIKDYYNLG